MSSVPERASSGAGHRFDWIMAVCGLALIAGLYLAAWADGHGRFQDNLVSTRYLMQAILANADGLGERAMRDAGMDVDELLRLLSEKPSEREP